MGLPLNLGRRFCALNRGEPPRAVVRALADVHGMTGETYLALGRERLVLFSTKLGSECQVLDYALEDIGTLERTGTHVDMCLRIEAAGRTWDLPVPSRETEAVDAIAEAWRRAVGDRAERPDGNDEARPDIGTDRAARCHRSPRGDAVPPLSPVIAFSAALQAMMRADETAGTEELHLLNRLIERPDAVEAGMRFLEQNGIEALLAKLPELLDDAQKACVYANLAELAMVDGKLRSTEKTLLQTFRAALGISDAENQTLDRVLHVKNDLSVFEYTDA